MTLRLAVDPAAAPPTLRPAARVAVVAAMLDCDAATVRRLVRGGKIEGYRLGRSLRVYLDSIRSFQDGRRCVGAPAEPPPRRRPTAEHDEAMAYLRRLGVL